MGLDRNLMIKDGVVCWLYPDGSQGSVTQDDVGKINRSVCLAANYGSSYLVELHTLVGDLLLTSYGELVPVNKEKFYRLKHLYEAMPHNGAKTKTGA